jgi:hypothetical protein
LLLRILRRFFSRRFSRRREVLFPHLKVVLLRDLNTIADPVADHMNQELLGEFRLPARPQVVEQLGPGEQPSPADDPIELGAQVL